MVEAGIDGGGLFKDFMDELLRQGFSPHKVIIGRVSCIVTILFRGSSGATVKEGEPGIFAQAGFKLDLCNVVRLCSPLLLRATP